MDEVITRNNILKYKDKAFSEEEYVVYYQPKYNQYTGMLVGAEALARWQSPEMGFVVPGQFIPVFEEDETITRLDLYVFEKICCLLKESKENNYYLVPISINFRRKDFFSEDFLEKLDRITEHYGIDCSNITVEITETSALGNADIMNQIIHELHQRGYRVAMDDFGRGYSSLNMLKNLDIDEIKIDMGFIDGEVGNKGGIILRSVIEMTKWLQIPLVMEGVETIEQSDFLKSIGCSYVQGFLFSKPVPPDEYRKLLSASSVGIIAKPLNLIGHFNAYNFWDPRSLDTFAFSHLVGGAAVFQYDQEHERLELLRVNEKYLQEMGMNKTQNDMILSDMWQEFDKENKAIFGDSIRCAIETNDEVSCETWRTSASPCCGTEHLCIRTDMRVIGQSGEKYLFYAMIRNVTAEKERYGELAHSDTIMRNTFDQVNIYYWEYNILTREMRPCFRCMRDLGLPPVVKNYPEPAIEQGIIPEEYAQMYRDLVAQLSTGVDKIEAIVPLTADRIPFKVRYTTEFDELGNPIRAFASATLV